MGGGGDKYIDMAKPKKEETTHGKESATPATFVFFFLCEFSQAFPLSTTAGQSSGNLPTQLSKDPSSRGFDFRCVCPAPPQALPILFEITCKVL